jgi:hypothetical protein
LVDIEGVATLQRHHLRLGSDTRRHV